MTETLGGLRFSIATGVIALFDYVLGLWHFCHWYSEDRKPTVPDWAVTAIDSLTAGLYLGSGSTLAARLNGELCDAGPSDPNFACLGLFSDMGVMFAGAVLTYVLLGCRYWVAAQARRALARSSAEEEGNRELDGGGGHALENPFADPVVGAEAEVRSEREVGKRRSWSQLS